MMDRRLRQRAILIVVLIIVLFVFWKSQGSGDERSRSRGGARQKSGDAATAGSGHGITNTGEEVDLTGLSPANSTLGVCHSCVLAPPVHAFTNFNPPLPCFAPADPVMRDGVLTRPLPHLTVRRYYCRFSRRISSTGESASCLQHHRNRHHHPRPADMDGGRYEERARRTR